MPVAPLFIDHVFGTVLYWLLPTPHFYNGLYISHFPQYGRFHGLSPGSTGSSVKPIIRNAVLARFIYDANSYLDEPPHHPRLVGYRTAITPVLRVFF